MFFSLRDQIIIQAVLCVCFGYFCPNRLFPYKNDFSESTVNFFSSAQILMSQCCCSYAVLPFSWSLGGWFWGRSQRTRLNEFPAKCPRSQGRAPRQRMAKQSMHPLASSIPTRVNLWKPKKLQVNFCPWYFILKTHLFMGRKLFFSLFNFCARFELVFK